MKVRKLKRKKTVPVPALLCLGLRMSATDSLAISLYYITLKYNSYCYICVVPVRHERLKINVQVNYTYFKQCTD